MTFGPQLSARGKKTGRTIMQSDQGSAGQPFSIDEVTTLRGSLSRRFHQINNLMTAFHCIWDSERARAGQASVGSAGTNDLADVIEQIQVELRGFQTDSCKLLSQLGAEGESKALKTDPSTANHSHSRSSTSDRASDRGPHSPETLKDPS